MTETKLKDVKCERCGRVIGQRDGGMFYQFGGKVLFTKSQKIFCPFLGCGHSQIFPVNRTQKMAIAEFFGVETA